MTYSRKKSWILQAEDLLDFACRPNNADMINPKNYEKFSSRKSSIIVERQKNERSYQNAIDIKDRRRFSKQFTISVKCKLDIVVETDRV